MGGPFVTAGPFSRTIRHAPSLYYPSSSATWCATGCFRPHIFQCPMELDPELDQGAEGRPAASGQLPMRKGVSADGMYKKAYAGRRCLIPIDGIFERRASSARAALMRLR
jgi:hypothetical protein